MLIFFITNNYIISNETSGFLGVFAAACRPDIVTIKYESSLCSDCISSVLLTSYNNEAQNVPYKSRRLCSCHSKENRRNNFSNPQVSLRTASQKTRFCLEESRLWKTFLDDLLTNELQGEALFDEVRLHFPGTILIDILLNHRIMESFRSEGIFKSHLLQSPAMIRDNFT